MKPLIKQIVAIKYPGVNFYIDVEKQWFPIGKLSTMLCLPHPCWFTGTFNAIFGARENVLMREGSGKRSVSSSQKTEHRDSGLSALICNYTVHAPIPVSVIAQHSHVSGWKITILNVFLQQIWEPKASCQVVPPRLVYKHIYSNCVYTCNASKHLITTKNIQKPDSQSSCVHQPSAIPNWGTCRSEETLKSSHPSTSVWLAGRESLHQGLQLVCLQSHVASQLQIGKRPEPSNNMGPWRRRPQSVWGHTKLYLCLHPTWRLGMLFLVGFFDGFYILFFAHPQMAQQ